MPFQGRNLEFNFYFFQVKNTFFDYILGFFKNMVFKNMVGVYPFAASRRAGKKTWFLKIWLVMGSVGMLSGMPTMFLKKPCKKPDPIRDRLPMLIACI